MLSHSLFEKQIILAEIPSYPTILLLFSILYKFKRSTNYNCFDCLRPVSKDTFPKVSDTDTDNFPKNISDTFSDTFWNCISDTFSIQYKYNSVTNQFLWKFLKRTYFGLTWSNYYSMLFETHACTYTLYAWFYYCMNIWTFLLLYARPKLAPYVSKMCPKYISIVDTISKKSKPRFT